MRSTSAAVVPALFLTATVAATAGTADLRLSPLLAADGRSMPASAVVDGPGAILAAAAGVDRLPLPCATVVLQAGDQAAPGALLRQAQALLSNPPIRSDDRIIATRDGRFALRVPGAGAPRDTPGPEFVARVAEALVASRAYLMGTLGYPDPAPGSDRVPVVITGLGHGLEGYAFPGRGGTRSAPFIVLDSGLAVDRIMPATLHQMAHLLLPPASRTGAAWGEAVASYLTLAGTGDLAAQREAIGAWLLGSARGFEGDSLPRLQGGLLWPLFLSERTGDPDVVRQIVTALSEDDVDVDEAADLALRRYGLTRAAALREMGVWALFTGSRNDGRHFAAAAEMPEADLVTLGPGLPLTLGPLEPVGPGGSVAFRLPADGVRGSLDVAIDVEGEHAGADLLTWYPGEDAPALVPVELTTGSGRVTLPWSDAREIWIVLRNEAAGDGAVARFTVALSRDPVAPFDLASFTASAAARTVTLEWVTASESGLVGWNVLRSTSPEGPFMRINAVAIPASGEGGVETGYVFVDDGARPGRRYYYVLEGLTAAGLYERSHAASARPTAR